MLTPSTPFGVSAGRVAPFHVISRRQINHTLGDRVHRRRRRVLTRLACRHRGDGTAAGVDGAFAVWNVVITFSDNDTSAIAGPDPARLRESSWSQ